MGCFCVLIGVYCLVRGAYGDSINEIKLILTHWARLSIWKLRSETIRRPVWLAFRGNQFEYPLFWQPKIPPSNGVHNAGALYYTITRYIPFGVNILMASSQSRITPGRHFSQLFEIFHYDQIVAHFWYASYWWRIDKEEGIRWRSYHLDQLQSWKSSQVRLVKISVGVIMLTERFCPVLMLRPFKKHSANTTTQKKIK